MENLDALKSLYVQDEKTQTLVDHLKLPENSILQLKGLTGSSLAFRVMATFKNKRDSQIIIFPNKEEAAYFQNDLQALFDTKSILFFADSFKKSGQFDRTERTNILMRTEVIEQLFTRSKNKIGEIIVTYPEAIIEKIINKKVFIDHLVKIKQDEKLNIDFLNELFIEWNFERTDFVEEAGQFSIRGGIIDIFSFGQEYPVRIELFGEEIESIRFFDLDSQLSIQKLDEITIIPDTHTHFNDQRRDSILEVLPKSSNIWLVQSQLITEQWQRNEVQIQKQLEANKDQEDQTSKDEFWQNCNNSQQRFSSREELINQLKTFNIIEVGKNIHFSPHKIIEFNTQPQAIFNKNFNMLAEVMNNHFKAQYKNYLFAAQPKQIERFYHIFEDMSAEVIFEPITKSLKEGFTDHDVKISCYADHQIFNRYHKYKMRRSFAKSTQATLKILTELTPGDYIVHVDHGVGKYAGIRKMDKDGVEHEMMRIVYGDNDNLYVSIQSLHKISKYVGKDGTPPKIHKLGSGAWEKAKAKTKKQVKDIATDLIKLYAERKAQKGFQFTPDTYLQNQLEASFLFEDTPDQEKATADVKQDMELEAPMDRLVCGDVGFGKTEIAIRAAAKAVADSKQVAILVPTTILAYQHAQSFKKRMKDFPCTIDYLNRFKNRKEQKETIQKLKDGSLDIIIGTHKLFSKEIEFKDLGLLIIDEEQKFGVAHKEKLKQLKVNVDTLTLTATPIPRTLQFSLMGARDLSVINTPPPNRQPVETEVRTFDQDLIAEAINFEVARGGQCFFIHNRVKDIEDIKILIQGLCPHIKVVVAHGQMDGKTLEDIFLKFMDGKYDLLLATSLIESGIDISNANTIIINDAQNFGLSDLHQLRGRVGRSNQKAFAYLLAPPVYALSTDARKRLEAIEQYSTLGSGFNIAMKDLDIRGAGNILGGEQSGFVNDMGMELYHKILDEAIQELKETDFKDLFKDEIIRKQEFVRDAQIDTDFEILIPDRYINNINERLSIYTRLDNTKNEKQLLSIQSELEDRFGPIPKQVQEIFSGIKLRWTCKRLGIERILLKSKKLKCIFTTNQSSPFYESMVFSNMLNFVQSNPDRCQLKNSPKRLILDVKHINSLGEGNTFLLQILQKEILV